MTGRHRSHREMILEPSLRDKDILPLSETFGRQSVEDLLNQYDCEALRIYYAMDQDQRIHAVLVGVGPDGNDLIPEAGLDEEEYFLLQRGVRSGVDGNPLSVLNA